MKLTKEDIKPGLLIFAKSGLFSEGWTDLFFITEVFKHDKNTQLRIARLQSRDSHYFTERMDLTIENLNAWGEILFTS